MELEVKHLKMPEEEEGHGAGELWLSIITIGGWNW
jgi:hypothetical protein